jgi:teichuronic acid biosynthesis glycosyltransferase TuaG
MVQKEFKDKVSIILPNFNSAKYISSTINSIKKQSYKYWNLIIVDDCSNVETKKILNKFNNKKKIKIFWLKKNKGAAYCRNLAIKKSKSKYLAFIDSDDIWEKNKLKLQIDYMRKNNFDFTYTYYKTFGLKLKKIKPPPRLNFEDFTKNTSIATSTMILNRKMAEGIKFTETAICEDYFFKCKILKKIKHAYCLKNYLTKYRVRQGSLQSSKIKNFFWIWKINYKYNKFNFFENLKSLLFISFNSIKKYGLK